ncbi:MAG: hypothetical protein IID40_10685 [Planctomycetes bacterium]|nr:hypothetical protein [Planctomycetota bacterium]
MKLLRLKLCLRLAAPAALFFAAGGCLGPNPGFFISTSAANTTISTLVNVFLGNALGLG